jgi:acyl dehydratase
VKPAAGINALRENALAVIFWQPLQWHAMVITGGKLTLKRTRLQRQLPSSGKVSTLITHSFS